MPGINENIRAIRPSIVNRKVIQMIANIMKRIVGSIIFNKYSGKEWLLSEAIVDLVWIHTYLSGDDPEKDLSKHLDTMVEEREETCKLQRT